MKLYYTPGACSVSPSIALHEAGLEFTPIKVNLETSTLEDGTDFKTINPKGQVPTLEISDGVILTEGPAILQYIADQAEEQNITPKNKTMERYRFQELLNFITSELHKGFVIFFMDNYPDEAKKISREILASKFMYINNILEEKDYLMGEFSLADAYMYNVTRWTPAAEINIKDDYKNIYDFMERMEKRSSVQKTLKTDEIDAFAG